jgi:centrin-3
MNEQSAFGRVGARGATAQYSHTQGPVIGHNQNARFQHGNPHAVTGSTNYGATSLSHQTNSQARRVRNAHDLSPEETEMMWFHNLDDAEKDGIDQSFSLFGDVHPDGLNFYDLRLALKALGFDLSNGDVKSWMDRFGQPPSDWRAADNDPKPLCHTVQLRMSQDTYRDVAACLVAHRPPRELWTKAFAVFDSDKKGLITGKDLRRASDQLGKDLTDNEIERMIQEADIEDRGGVDLEEFIVIMERSSRRVASFA